MPRQPHRRAKLDHPSSDLAPLSYLLPQGEKGKACCRTQAADRVTPLLNARPAAHRESPAATAQALPLTAPPFRFVILGLDPRIHA